jgi:hypothetical protein
MKSFVVPVLGLGFLALSCLSLHAAQFIWHPGEDAEDSPFADMGRLVAPSPHFHGAEMPTPPQQGQPWTPPKSQLPEVALDAMKALFDEGLADPRGCDYREIKVAVGNCWSGDSGVVTTHGWIIPGKNPFAICWNGLVYPVVSTGPAADLRADILAMLTADRQQLKKQGFVESETITAPGMKKTYTSYPAHVHASVTERQGVSYKSMLPFKAVLLLRLGEGGLANDVWSQWNDTRNEDPANDPYLWLADAWVWAAFDRAVDAHMRGDDNLALVTARDLVPIQAAVEAEASRRNFPLAEHEKTYLYYLGQIPDLVADSQQRVAEPASTPVLDMDPPPKGAERIAGLIRDLELVSARQMGEPGGVSLGQDPIIQALIHEGDPAVDPLLKCLEDDPRLTRSVHFWRDNSTDRTVLSVYEAAYVALATILQTDFFGINSTGDNLTKRGPEGRREIASKIRAYWDKYGKLTLPQRWCQTLGDDQAAPMQWREAVANIVQPSDVTVTAGSSYMGGFTSYPPRQPGQKPPMRGEPLRSVTNPSVSDLLIRRLHEAEKWLNPGAKDDENNDNLNVADQVARALADWDGPNQFAELRGYSGMLQGLLETRGHMMFRPMAAMYEKRVEAGDASALDEYAKWLEAMSSKGMQDQEARELLRVAWLNPNSPVIQKTLADIFSEKGSWSRVANVGLDSPYRLESIFTTPLVGIAGFRQELMRGLRDKTNARVITVQNGTAYLEPWQQNASWNIDKEDALIPPPGTSVSFRECDYYAFLLARLPGAPKCQLYWPLADRDKAVAAIIDYLQKCGDLLKYGPDQIEAFGEDFGHNPPMNPLGPFGRDRARLRFPALDHPATPEDLRQHRAIFALEGKRRVWKLPKIPIEILWTTLKDEPRQSGGGMGPDGKPIYETYYETDGVAWQAEEVLTNGEWERFLGVVTKHHVARVPASDIEFILPGYWSQMPHGFDCLLTTPHGDTTSWRGCYTYEPVPQGQPVLATLAVRNRSGLDQTLPADFFQDAANAKTLPTGVKLGLLYSDKMPPKPKPDGGFPQPNEMEPWTEIPIRATSSPTSGGKTPVAMASTTEKTLFKIDLRDFFDLSRPGSYRLQADIQRPGTLVGQPAETSFTVVVSAPASIPSPRTDQ